MNKIPVIAVVGPTASGKTSLGIALAKRFDGEVVSADSMQIYRGMDIATAKPTIEEQDGVVHHLIDFLDQHEAFSVAEYAELAHRVIADIHARGKLPIIVGGTGLYVDSVLNDIVFTEIRTDAALREKLHAFAKENGNAALLSRLKEVDPELAAKLHENNLGRIVRALEVFELTGVTMSEQQRRSSEKPSRYRVLKFGLNYDNRDVLYQRIERRVDLMIEQGLLAEAETVLSSPMKTAVQAIGYKELAPYFAQEAALDDCIAKLKLSTRHYAKRQLTWFLRDTSTHWLYPDREEMSVLLQNAFSKTEHFLTDEENGINSEE